MTKVCRISVCAFDRKDHPAELGVVSSVNLVRESLEAVSVYLAVYDP